MSPIENMNILIEVLRSKRPGLLRILINFSQSQSDLLTSFRCEVRKTW